MVLAVETDPEVRSAGIAGVGPAGWPGGGPIATAGVAVVGHRKSCGRRGILKKQKGINLAVDPLVMGPQYALTRALRSATEPTEAVSTALPQARPLCQPLVDTENHQNLHSPADCILGRILGRTQLPFRRSPGLLPLRMRGLGFRTSTGNVPPWTFSNQRHRREKNCPAHL